VLTARHKTRLYLREEGWERYSCLRRGPWSGSGCQGCECLSLLGPPMLSYHSRKMARRYSLASMMNTMRKRSSEREHSTSQAQSSSLEPTTLRQAMGQRLHRKYSGAGVQQKVSPLSQFRPCAV